mmetsp:Transcript_8454/g.19935  ORF Transcript_8454/g.19935 Transcript_8454/m.19935 type:complete len:242 (+) Transcript_8454:32-757(+)
MTDVLSFLRDSLNALNLDGQLENTEILNRSKSAPAEYASQNSAPRSALRSKNGPRSPSKQNVRFVNGKEEIAVHDDIDVGTSSPPQDTQASELHEFDRLVRMLDAQQKGQLREFLVQRKFGKGESIIRSGSHGDAIFFIGFGSCRQLGTEGRSVELAAGDYFGEREALKSASGEEKNILDTFLKLQPERKVDVIAGEKGCVVYECPGETFAKIFGGNKEAMAMIETRSKNRTNTLNDKIVA